MILNVLISVVAFLVCITLMVLALQHHSHGETHLLTSVQGADRFENLAWQHELGCSLPGT